MNTEKENIYRVNITESLGDIDRDRYHLNKIDTHKLSRLGTLVESYSVLFPDSEDKSFFESRYEKLVAESHMRINEGFMNPFDTFGDDEEIEVITKTDPVDVSDTKPSKIKGISLWNTETNNKVMCKNGKMIAGQFFGKGDIIERCPVRLVGAKDLYSRNIRDVAFPIDRAAGVYAIPFGYALFYRNSYDTGIDPNAEYNYTEDEDGRAYIEIVATSNIRMGHEIMLAATQDDFDNAMHDHDFDYTNHGYTAIRDVKIA